MDVSVTEVLLSLVLFVISWVLFVPRFQAWHSKNSRFSQLMGKIPGGKTSLIFGDSYDFIVKPQNKFMDLMTQAVKDYGSIFRIWMGPFMGTVHVCSWKYAEDIFSSNVHIEKSSTYSFVHAWLGTGLLTSTGAKWHSRRKMLTPAFHRTILDSYQEVFVDKTSTLLKLLETKSKESKVFDIAPFIWQCSLDIICETAMGTNMDIQKKVSEEDAAYLKSISFVAESTLHRFLKPWLHSKIIFDLSSRGREFNKSVKIMHTFSNKVIKAKKQEYSMSHKNGVADKNEDIGLTKKRKAFIDILIEAAFAEGHDKKPILSDEDIREEVDTFMFEGHDTTASGISWTIYLLGLHPEIQEDVAAEINEVYGKEKINSTQKLSELRLLDRCVRESLRLYPSVPMIARKLREDVQLGEYLVPAETELVIHMFHMHRDKELFPEPEKFNPDNFLPEACEKRPAFAFVPFSAGSRNCIGQKFAMQEAKTVVASIVQNFKIKSAEQPKDLILLPELILRSEKGIKVTLQPRN
ncbi:cytochrome P450 4C1-like isoform X2 [Ischnura elegans]|uniref:cytochrome P450 4C1-like isoform X2 n=1 Tax=Ischnura elegans TaxID=197161 RepID=UPI001ED88616|nr:cytochrome P450 4C1-like isoform X2 [Ischnura elegans]